MKRILVINDEPSIVTLLMSNSGKKGYKVASAADGGGGLELALEQSFDLIILDTMLPMIDSMKVTQRLHQERNETPILMLTAKGDQVDRIVGLEIGVDDCSVKPFSSREILTRMKTIFRRIGPRRQSKDEVEPEYPPIGQTIVDLTNYQVTMDDYLIELTPKEFGLLVHPMEREDHAIDHDTLLDCIWNFNFAGQSRIVDIYVSHLREKAERDPKHPKYLATVRGSGYKFQEPK